MKCVQGDADFRGIAIDGIYLEGESDSRADEQP